MKIHSTQIHGGKAKEALLKGAYKAYRAVSTTLGSRGQNVVVHKNHQTRTLHDGYQVIRHINPKDPYENAGAEILKQAAYKQVQNVGDGTTAVTILGYEIAKETLKLTNSGINPMSLRAALEKGRDILVEEIQKHSTKVKTEEELINVATISSEDTHMGKIIGEVFHKHGLEAVIVPEEGVGETVVEHQEGMQIDTGYILPHFVTNPANMTANISDASIFVTDHTITNFDDLTPFLEKFLATGKRNIVFFVENMEGSALPLMIKNKMEGKINALVVKAPSFKTRDHLDDIAIATGATLISSDAGMSLRDVTPDDLGHARKVSSTDKSTVIMDGGGDTKAVKDRISALKRQIKEADAEFDAEKAKERLARLTGGVYVIRVGGYTETEVDERKERADDAIRSTRAALEEGIVAGGETIYLKIQSALTIDYEADQEIEYSDIEDPYQDITVNGFLLNARKETEEYAYRILTEALKAPFNKLIENAGYNSGQLLERLSREQKGYGVDVTDGEIKDMFKAGIVDATKISTQAITNAVSVAISIITADCIVNEVQELDK